MAGLNYWLEILFGLQIVHPGDTEMKKPNYDYEKLIFFS